VKSDHRLLKQTPLASESNKQARVGIESMGTLIRLSSSNVLLIAAFIHLRMMK
jgi:hypothetical protein